MSARTPLLAHLTSLMPYPPEVVWSPAQRRRAALVALLVLVSSFWRALVICGWAGLVFAWLVLMGGQERSIPHLLWAYALVTAALPLVLRHEHQQADVSFEGVFLGELAALMCGAGLLIGVEPKGLLGALIAIGVGYGILKAVQPEAENEAQREMRARSARWRSLDGRAMGGAVHCRAGGARPRAEAAARGGGDPPRDGPAAAGAGEAARGPSSPARACPRASPRNLAVADFISVPEPYPGGDRGGGDGDRPPVHEVDPADRGRPGRPTERHHGLTWLIHPVGERKGPLRTPLRPLATTLFPVVPDWT